MLDGDYLDPERRLVMTTAKEYHALAKKCFVRVEMASYWIDAAMRTECLGDSCIEPEQQAA